MSRNITLINHSKKKIEITFDVGDQLEELKKMFINISAQGNIIVNPR